MTDLSRLGEELRAELGAPPASWTDRQRLRLRGLDLTPTNHRRPQIFAAALAACALLAVGIGYWLDGSEDPSSSGGKNVQAVAPRAVPLEEVARGEALWVEAQSESMTHNLDDGSAIRLEAGARGRLDQGEDMGNRFDLHAGTATFDVKKQGAEPFSVVAGRYRVVVVGTKFTTAYVPPRQLSVTVDEGVVQVYIPDRPEAIRVGADELLEIVGQKFSLRNRSDEATPSEPEAGDVSDTARSEKMSWGELYRQGQYQKACKAARDLSLDRLRTSLAAGQLTELANSLRLCGDTQGAMTTLNSLRQRFPGSSHAHDASFLMGRIYATQGQTAEAISHLDQYLTASGGGRFAAEALGRLIELHQASGNRQKALRSAQRYLQLAPQGPYRQLAESVADRP